MEPKRCRSGRHVLVPTAFGRCRDCKRERDAEWARSPKGKAARRRFDASEAGRARYSRYNRSPRGRERRWRYLQTYKGYSAKRAADDRYRSGLHVARLEQLTNE